MRTQAQKAAWEAKEYQRLLAERRRQAVPVVRINPLTGKPLEEAMAKQAKAEMARLEAMLEGVETERRY